MYLTKKHLYVSIILLFIATIGIVLFLQPMQVNEATDDMIEQLNKKYDDDFQVMWSNIEEQPSLQTFQATVKSNNSGYVYDVDVKNTKATIQYVEENVNMDKINIIETKLGDVFALTNDSQFVLLTVLPLTEQQLTPLSAQLGTGEVVVYQLEEENYQIATKHINEYYARSSVPLEDLLQYNPKIYTIKLL